jgi:hypothetical protein
MAKRYSPTRRDLYLAREAARKDRTVVVARLRRTKLLWANVRVSRIVGGK